MSFITASPWLNLQLVPNLKHTDRLLRLYCVGLLLWGKNYKLVGLETCFDSRLEHNASIELLLKYDEKVYGVLPDVQVTACVCVCVGVLYVRWYSLYSVTWNFCNRKPLDKGPSVGVSCCFFYKVKTYKLWLAGFFSNVYKYIQDVLLWIPLLLLPLNWKHK